LFSRSADYDSAGSNCSRTSVYYVLYFSTMFRPNVVIFRTLVFINSQDRRCKYKYEVEARQHSYFWRGRAISITYSECVSVALVIQQARRIRLIVLSSFACGSCITFSHITSSQLGIYGIYGIYGITIYIGVFLCNHLN
jgi:hypothetical protein